MYPLISINLYYEFMMIIFDHILFEQIRIITIRKHYIYIHSGLKIKIYKIPLFKMIIYEINKTSF